jgi:glutathione S-transferase
MVVDVLMQTTLTISSKNYSSWSLRGWLMLKLSGLPFQEIVVSPDDVDNRAELLLLSPSILVPRVWDTMAIGEYLNELKPKAHLLPKDPVARAHCRSVCGEMHSGFSALRASLPMNIKAKFESFKIWSKAQIDINRVLVIWQDCLSTYGGPFLFGKEPTLADAMFAPVVTRFLTYHVALDKTCEKYCDHIMAMPEMKEWVMGALEEPDDIEELEVEF